MEQEAAIIAAAAADIEGRCRLCFSVEDLTCSLFPPEGEPSREVIDMILECTSIRITLAEDYPSKVCEKCLETLDKFYHYRQRCLQNDKILKSQRSSKAKPAPQEHPVQVKQEPEQLDDPAAQDSLDQQPESDQHAQLVKQEDPGGCSSILRSILLQSRESGRAASTASAEHEPEQDNLAAVVPQPDEDEDHKDPSLAKEEPPPSQPQLPPAQASLLQQMLLQQQGFSSRETHSPAHPGPSALEASPSLLKRMLMEGGGSNQDRQSPLEGPSTLNHRSAAAAEDQQSPINHHQHHLHPHHHHHHDENHNEEHSETPLASQLRAILLQHRAAAAAVAAATASSTSTGMMTMTTTTTTTPATSSSTSHEQQQQQQQQQQQPSEKPEVSYLRSLFLRNDSDGNEDSENEVVVDPNEQANREMLFNMFQELQARNEQNSDDTDDSEDRAFDYRIPSVRRRSSESTDSRKRRRMDFTCMLCGRPFLNRSKLVLHMRTHIAGPESTPPPSSTVAQNSSTAAAAAAAAALAAGGGSVATAAAVAAAAAAAAAVGPVGHGDNAGTGAGTAEDDEESRQIELLERRSYACYICGADQNNLQQLKEHLLLAHQDRIRSRGRAKERPKPLINCNFCSRQFRSQFAYGEHLRTHTGERPFPCDQCDKRFPRRFQLLGHLYNVHKQSWVADESKAKFVKK